jgi:hypothetical protein
LYKQLYLDWRQEQDNNLEDQLKLLCIIILNQ